MKSSNATRMYEDSIRNYGKHKLIPLVQSIYEFNPYTNINYFVEGLNESNIEELFYINGRLVDVIVDAADDGITKVLIRSSCEKHKFPLVYGFDEKGIVAIQRYDFPELINFLELDFTKEQLTELKRKNPNE
jgi:tRNA A37 threonylcarbamoyladenosine dehydratase